MDRVFAAVVEGLPRELRETLAEAELLDSRVLDAYPRSSAEELGLLNASHRLARIRRTRKGAGQQCVCVALSSSLELDLDSSPLTVVGATVCSARVSSDCRSVDHSLARASVVKDEIFEIEDLHRLPGVSCHSELRVGGASQSTPRSSIDGESSKNARQSQPVSSRDGGSSKVARQSQRASSTDARQCQPLSSGGQHGSEVFARSDDQVALDKVAVTVEKAAALDVASADLATVLKHEFPTVCPDMQPGFENSVDHRASISRPSSVLCQPFHLDSAPVPDETLLFHTLVRDGVLQLTFQEDFKKLARAAQTSADRHRRQRAFHDNLEAALELHEHREKIREQERVKERVLDQFAAAAKLPHRRYHARYQSSLEEGPTARRDAEEAERLRWVTLLGDLLRSTQTPMGQILSTKPGNIQLLGGGKRASTLRSRVRGVQKFLSWLAIHQEKVFPDSVSQLLEFLQVRLSEPCNRGSLKGSHRALVFLEDTAGVPAVERLTNTQLYNVSYKELLASASPAQHAKQAPRVPVAILSALEGLVVDTQAAIYLRTSAWWLLLQNWATLRFSDHRGIEPKTVTVQARSWRALLTRSKTIGADRSIVSRPLVVDPCCFICHSDWLTVGCGLLQQHAGYERDYLLPAPTSNLLGFRKQVLRYDTAFALQIRAFRSLRSASGPLLFPTLHSCANSLSLTKEDHSVYSRTFLGSGLSFSWGGRHSLSPTTIWSTQGRCPSIAHAKRSTKS